MGRPFRAPLRLRGKAGFTLLELLVVIAIMALTAAIVLPGTKQLIEINQTRNVFFDFQRQVTDLRRRTFHEERATVIVTPEQFEEMARADDPDPSPAYINLEGIPGWTYKMSAPITIGIAGECTESVVELYKNERMRARLALNGEQLATCRFLRQAAAG